MTAFINPNLTPSDKPIEYSHGFTDSEVYTIKQAKLAIEKRDLDKEPVTLEEFEKVIIPWNRIHRTEQFILHPPKKTSTRKPRTVKTSVPRVAKPKKLTKKAISEKLNDIIFRQATGKEITQEEATFLEEYTKNLPKLT